MTVTTPDLPRTDGGVLLFRSCLVSAEYPGVESATKWLLDRLGIEYIVHPDQSCCTGLGYYSDVIPFPTTAAIAARNACVAVESDHPTVGYLCSTCYAVNKKAQHVLSLPEERAKTNAVLARIGRTYDDRVDAAIRHVHVLEIIWGAHASLPELVRRRLDGIKVATHPACHYCKVFPDDVTGEAENFMLPEDLLEPAGITATGYYNEKTTHCGAGFRQRFINPAISLAVTQQKLRRLSELGVDVLLHMCPNCHVQFDRFHDLIAERAGEMYPFIHLHAQQLLALALGADPDTVCGVATHSQNVEPFLERIGARTQGRVALPVDAGPGARASSVSGVNHESR